MDRALFWMMFKDMLNTMRSATELTRVDADEKTFCMLFEGKSGNKKVTMKMEVEDDE